MLRLLRWFLEKKTSESHQNDQVQYRHRRVLLLPYRLRSVSTRTHAHNQNSFFFSSLCIVSYRIWNDVTDKRAERGRDHSVFFLFSSSSGVVASDSIGILIERRIQQWNGSIKILRDLLFSPLLFSCSIEPVNGFMNGNKNKKKERTEKWNKNICTSRCCCCCRCSPNDWLIDVHI